jgi:hypothetical protein
VPPINFITRVSVFLFHDSYHYHTKMNFPQNEIVKPFKVHCHFPHMLLLSIRPASTAEEAASQFDFKFDEPVQLIILLSIDGTQYFKQVLG